MFEVETKREIAFVALGTILLSALEIGVFFALGYYTDKVLFGACLSAGAGILNFFLLALTVEKVLTYPPEEEAGAKNLMKLSRVSRMLLLLALLAVGAWLFDVWSTLITALFPSIVIRVRALLRKR